MNARRGHVTLADIFRRHGDAYLASHLLARSQAKAWRAIVTCRTQALGGHVEQCDSCGITRHVYHSCRNRHCPQCQTRAKEQWVAQRQRDLLPVPYYHLVFTIPHALNSLAGKQPRLITEVLFGAAAATLTEFGANDRWLGGRLAFSLVLHTWSQTLIRHLHVHALVAGGALSSVGTWITSKRGFLFPVKALSAVFRAKFIDALAEARNAGHVDTYPVADKANWQRLLCTLRRRDWVVYAKQPLGGPAQVLDYLSRYTHRVAISNDRLVSLRHGIVSFRVRDKANVGKKRTEELPAETFIERFLLHVLPTGLKRIRHYGILASCHKQHHLAACRAALSIPEPEPVVIETVQSFMRRVASIDIVQCRCCSIGRMHVVAMIVPERARCRITGPPP